MIYLDAIPENETRILSCSDSSNHANGSFWVSIYPESDGFPGEPWSFTYVDAEGNPHTLKADWGVGAGGWTPYTITYDGTWLIMYLGAEPVIIEEAADLELSTATFPVWIGNSASQGFTGKLDNFLLYDRALTEEEIYNYIKQYIFFRDLNEETIYADPGDTIVLTAKAKAPFLNYLFKKGEVVLQEGVDSTLVINGLKPEDFGAYTCVIFNCTDEQTKTFIVEQNCQPSDLQITGQTGDLYVYENGSVQFGVQVTGGSESTVYDWFFKGKPIDRHSWQMGLEEVSEADTGYYYCRILEPCDTFYSDSIYLGLLPGDVYPYVDTSGILIHYGFNGNFTDSTIHTGPATMQNVQFDSGLFSLPNTAVSFPAPQGSLEIEDTSYLDLNMPFSIILLLKTDALPGSTTPILSKPGTDTGSHGNYSLYVHPDGYLSFDVTGDDNIQYTCTSATPLQPGRWHMVLAYFDNSEIGLMIDENQWNATSMNGTGLITNQNNLVIGNLSDETPGLCIDELWMYNRGMKPEFPAFINLFRPRTEVYHLTESACPPDEVVLSAYAYGPFLQYRFYRDTVTLQEGLSSSCVLQIGDEADLGDYYCDVYNAYDTITLRLSVESDKLYEGLYLYDSNDDVEFYTEHDDVHLSFYVSTNFGGLVYEMYHNGELIVSGTYSGSVDFGSGVTLDNSMEGAFLVKFDTNGKAVWAKNMQSESGFAETFDVSVDDLDRIYLTGMYLSDMRFDTFSIGYQEDLREEIFLTRFDAAGNCTMLRSYGSTGDGGDFGVCFEPVSDSVAYLMGLFGDELIMGKDTLVADPNSGGAGVSPNMFFCKMTPDGDPLQLAPAGIRSRSYSGEIMAAGEGQVIFAGMNEVSLVKKSSMATNITLAFAGLKTMTADTAGNPGTDPGTDPGTGLGASDEIESLFRVYPNPVSKTVYIQTTVASQFDLEIYSMDGVKISAYRHRIAYEVDVSSLTPGVYILKMYMEGEQAYGRLLVQ
ncbi:MAG: T9SS type A sorting domain-containing protein [Bacteroidales bacterium]|nr:T9SS type A sorting domain-containing protein [Bacteroidales bacterium]